MARVEVLVGAWVARGVPLRRVPRVHRVHMDSESTVPTSFERILSENKDYIAHSRPINPNEIRPKVEAS